MESLEVYSKWPRKKTRAMCKPPFLPKIYPMLELLLTRNPTCSIRGLKAALKNPHVSEKAKEADREKLKALGETVE